MGTRSSVWLERLLDTQEVSRSNRGESTIKKIDPQAILTPPELTDRELAALFDFLIRLQCRDLPIIKIKEDEHDHNHATQFAHAPGWRTERNHASDD